MDKITDVMTSTYTESKFVQPYRLSYNQDGVNKFWDLIEVHPSVAVIIFNVTRKVLVFVKQFRPPVYYSSIPKKERSGKIDTNKYPGSLGVTLELCAGVVDKQKPLAEIAQEEILEECGYQVPLSNIQRVKSYPSNVGTAGETQTLFYAEVTDEMQVTKGGGVAAEGELIEVIEMSVPQILEFTAQDSVKCPVGMLYAINWFLQNKASCN